MAEVDTPTQVVEGAEVPLPGESEEERKALAEFEGGFSETDTPPTETTPPVVETPTEIPAETPVDTTVTSVEVPASPKLAEITEEQFQSLVAKAHTVDELLATVEKLRGDAFGKIGGIERILRTLQEATPTGHAIEVSDKDLEELTEEYPELAPRLAKSLTRVLSKFKGTGATSAFSAEELNQRIVATANEIANAAAVQQGQRTFERVIANQLDSLQPGWAEITGHKDSQTPYRIWLKTQPEAYQKKILASYDPAEIAGSITAFKKTQEKPKPTVVPRDTNPRTQRLAEAVPVRGASGKPPAPRVKTPEEELLEGYES